MFSFRFSAVAAAVLLAATSAVLFPACTRVDSDTPAAIQIDRGNRLLDSYRSNKRVIDDAIASFEAAIRSDPQNAEAYVGLSRAYGTAKDFDRELTTAQ